MKSRQVRESVGGASYLCGAQDAVSAGRSKGSASRSTFRRSKSLPDDSNHWSGGSGQKGSSAGHRCQRTCSAQVASWSTEKKCR